MPRLSHVALVADSIIHVGWGKGKPARVNPVSVPVMEDECLSDVRERIISWQLDCAAWPSPAPPKPSSSSRAAAARQWDASLDGGRVGEDVHCM